MFQNTLLLGGGGGGCGGEIERNDSGVGSETSGTAQRLRRLRRLRCQHHGQPAAIADRQDAALANNCSDDDDADAPVTQHDAKQPANDAVSGPNWCVDCELAVETDPDDG